MGESIIARLEHKIYLTIKRKRLKNTNPTIISSNCNGSYILHDMGLKFNTPTVNLFFEPKEFLKFVKNMDRYLSADIIEVNSRYRFPVGQLDDIYLYFMHYSSFEEAVSKWDERKGRINKDNLFVMMTERNGCTYNDIKEFDNLPYKNKVIFTQKPYNEFKSAVYIRGFEDKDEIGVLSDWKHGFWKRRFLDDFDYVSFLNGKGV